MRQAWGGLALLAVFSIMAMPAYADDDAEVTITINGKVYHSVEECIKKSGHTRAICETAQTR
jgi:hypothetical protein